MKKEYRNAVRTKKMIRAAFAQLLGEKRNMESITVGALVERADIAKSTFYNHYEDIYAVAEEFENELIDNLLQVLDKIESEKATEYEVYIKSVINFLKDHEEVYRKVMVTPDVRFFIEKLKSIIAKKVFEESTVLPFSQNRAQRYIQIRLLTNACIDTVADYFRGNFEMNLDEVGDVIIEFLEKLKQ